MDREFMWRVMPVIIASLRERTMKYDQPLIVVEGEALGADSLAREWAEQNNVYLGLLRFLRLRREAVYHP